MQQRPCDAQSAPAGDQRPFPATGAELVDNQDSMNVDELCEHLTQSQSKPALSGNNWQRQRRISVNITLARIDDRLIHGQVTTVGRKWLTPSALLSAMTKFITISSPDIIASGCATGNEG